MTGRLAFLALAGALSACDAPPPSKPPAPVPAPAPAATISAQQVQERSAQCERKAREKFQRENPAAEFAYHYNGKLDTCFYLLTITQQETLSRKLLDINENETYGEYLGPASGAPATCRVESMYCASGREWGVLVEPYMKN